MLKYTELKSTNRQNLRDVLPLPKPFTVLIEPTSLCNFRCVQCFQSLKTETYFTRTRGSMPLERFREVLRQLGEWPGPKLKVLKTAEPPGRSAGVKVGSAAELVQKLKVEAGVI